MSLLTTAYLLERYGPRLGVSELADVLGISAGTLHNRLYRGQIDLATYLDGGKRYADVRDVADYLDKLRATARAPAANACSAEAAAMSGGR